jgi:lipopolysaccharide transport system ATP-binding protein
LGTGFHPELTGRENVYLNGAILGMARREIQQKLDAIVDFAELWDFVDTPVKYYSSGMHARLAFAVAAHLESEILLVDEVLAVGDAAFQKKCLSQIGRVSTEGRTVLFVSHNLLSMQGLCKRVLWLDGGQIAAAGDPSAVVSAYLRTCLSARTEQYWDDLGKAPGTPAVRLRRASVRALDDSRSELFTVHTPLAVEFEYWNLVPGAYLNVGLQLYNGHGLLVFDAGAGEESAFLGRPLPAGLYREYCVIPGDLLNDGSYRVVLNFLKNQSTLIHREEEVLMFDVVDAIKGRSGWYGQWDGVIRPKLEWRTQLVAGLDSLQAVSVANGEAR